MRARVCWSAQALEMCRCGRCIVYRNSINVCVLSGRQPLGSNCRGTSKWGVLTDPGAWSSPSPCTTIRVGRTSGLTTATVTASRCARLSTLSINQHALSAVESARLAVRTPTCLGNHRRAHFSGSSSVTAVPVAASHLGSPRSLLVSSLSCSQTKHTVTTEIVSYRIHTSSVFFAHSRL